MDYSALPLLTFSGQLVVDRFITKYKFHRLSNAL